MDKITAMKELEDFDKMMKELEPFFPKKEKPPIIKNKWIVPSIKHQF